jgi:hypothetical protein
VASSGRKLHIIVTCTERKTAPVPERLHLRDIPDGTPVARATAWVERLASEVTTSPVRVLDLYAGEHWRVATSLPGLATGAATSTDAGLWACSAGYGLIPAHAMVRPYAATLSPGHADSVSGGWPGAAAWWQSIGSWEGPDPGAPRTIAELVKSDPDATFILVLSATYLQACREDIEAAATAIGDPDRLMIVSSGTRPTSSLGEMLLPTDARLQAYLGGTRQVLNIRIAADLLAGQLTTRTAAISYLVGLLDGQPEIQRYDRKKLSDDEVTRWIRDAQDEMPGASASRMLRVFRDVGYACEQSRFGELHRKFSATLDSGGLFSGGPA